MHKNHWGCLLKIKAIALLPEIVIQMVSDCPDLEVHYYLNRLNAVHLNYS